MRLPHQSWCAIIKDAASHAASGWYYADPDNKRPPVRCTCRTKPGGPMDVPRPKTVTQVRS